MIVCGVEFEAVGWEPYEAADDTCPSSGGHPSGWRFVEIVEEYQFIGYYCDDLIAEGAIWCEDEGDLITWPINLPELAEEWLDEDLMANY